MDARQTPTHAAVARVELDHNAVVLRGKRCVARIFGEFTEAQVRFEMVRDQLERPSKLLARLGSAVHVDEQSPEVDHAVCVARVQADLTEIELPSSFQPAHQHARVCHAGVEPRQRRIELGRFLQARHRAFELPPIHEAFSHRGIRRGVGRIQLQREIEMQLGVIVPRCQSMHVDQLDVGINRRRIPSERFIEPTLGILSPLGVEQDRRDLETGLSLNAVPELVSFPECGQSRIASASSGKRQAQIEMPLGLIRVDFDGLPESGLGLVPPPELVELVGAFDVLFSILPLVHRGSSRCQPTAIRRGWKKARIFRLAIVVSTRVPCSPKNEPAMTSIRPLNPSVHQTRMLTARAAAAALLWSGTVLGQPDATRPPPSASETRAAEFAAMLRDAQTESDVRVLERMLTDEADPQTRIVLLETIAAEPSVANELDEALIGVVGLGGDDERPAALRALGSTATQRSARVLVNHAAPFMPSAVNTAAIDGLIRMTGRADLGRDHATWRQWLERVESLDEAAWQQELISGLRGGTDGLQRDLDAAVLATTDVYKRHFRVVPFQDRDGLLAEMLRAGGALQQLGIELLYREIAGNRQIGDVVGEAALEMLASPETSTRVEAARLLATLRPPQAGTRLTRALEIETEPRPAKALLGACARWPRVAAVQPALRWLEFGSATRDEASTLLFALDSEGLLTSPADRRRTASALRLAGPAKLTPDGLRLLVLTGTEVDREAVASLIDEPDVETRGAAAAALSSRPEFLGRIVTAAGRDPVLYPAAVTAIATHRRTASGYETLRRIQPPSDNAARTGLLAVARTLSVDDVLTVARTIEVDPDMRIAVLSTVGTAAATPAERATINETKLLLAMTQLELERPEPALASLAQIVSTSDDVNARADAMRVTGLLWLNRIDEARGIDVDAETWLSAIERFASEPHAAQVARETLTRYGDVLQPSERDRLTAVAAVAQNEQDASEPDGG